jgi:hypothetical protein
MAFCLLLEVGYIMDVNEGIIANRKAWLTSERP